MPCCAVQSGVNCGDAGMEAVATALPRTRVRVFDFSANQVGESGWAAFTTVLPQLLQLKRVFAQSNLLGAEGVPALVAGLVALERHRERLPDGRTVYPAGLERLQLQDNPALADEQAMADLRAVVSVCPELKVGLNPAGSSPEKEALPSILERA